MGTVRKYNKNTKQWEAISTADANAIKVLASELIPEGLNHIDVESVLLNMHEDIKTLKGNVSWLAKYGGGGSGGGGGSSEGTITVNDQQSGSSIVLDDELKIKVKASSSNLKWEITAYGGNTLIKYTSASTSLIINKADLTKAGINKTFTLSITAFNSDTLTSLYWDGLIVISTVTITTEDLVSYKYSPELSQNIVYNYLVGVSGNYYLKINGYTITGTAINLSTLSGSITVNLSDLMVDDTLEETTKLQPGVNKIKAELINVDNPKIYGYFISSIILTTENPILYLVTLSEFLETPTEIQVYGNSVTVEIPFNVYYSGITYVYYITCSKLDDDLWNPIDNNSWGTVYTQYNVYNSNAGYYISPENITIDNLYKLTIAVLDVISNLIYTIDRYIKLINPKTGLLETRVNSAQLFEFCTFNGTIQNGLWSVGNTFNTEYTMSIQNVNNVSASINNETKSLRLQNASYAKVPFDTKVLNSGKEFTLHICYKPDYHPDLDRTILQWNDLGNPASAGILLKNKLLYLFTNKVITLEEKEVLDITITYKSENTTGTNGTAFVYLDGVIEYVLNVSYDLIVPQINTDFYIGASYSTESFDFADINLYNFSLYNKCLSPYDILLNRLNNQARVNLKNGIPNTDYITSGLRRNFLSSDESGTKVLDSMLYNIKSLDISFNNNNTSNDLKGLLNTYFNVANFIDASTKKLKTSITNYEVPIPIIYINVGNNPQWTWANFIAPLTSSDSLLETSAIAEYYDQKLDLGSIYTLNQITVEPQGTSTLADYIKNLNIKFADGVLFSPKETWFPEQTYTIKADIVDSSHSLNSAIGKFVNTDLGTINNPFYPFSPVVLETFKNHRDLVHFPKATLKHGVEGFPVLVLMNFYNTQGLDVHSLGIYQFILGRESPRNLGYEIVTDVKNTDGTEVKLFTYPLYREGVQLTTKSVKGYWFEYGENESFSDDTDFLNLLEAENPQETINNTKLIGAFWQSDANYYNKLVDIKYSNLGNAQVSSPYDFKPFREFVENVQKLPVTVKRYSDADGFKRKTFGGGMTYPKYNYVIDNSGNYSWIKTSENVQTASRGDALTSVTANLNLESVSKFFVIAMLFGLLDNFLKNLPIKFYQREDGTWEPALLGIYDTDSGAGQNNQAEQNVTESLWMCGLANTSTDFYECKRGNNSTIVATSNKLWFLDSDDLNYSSFGVGENDKGSIYATQWNRLKQFFNSNSHQFDIDGIKSAISIKQFPEYFIKNYFIPLTEGCGELLFNLTYIAKYITKYEIEGGSGTNQINKLHGRRLYLVKNWLTNRVKFLDSLFNAMGLLQGETEVKSLQSVSITAALGPELKITTNSPVIVKYTNLGGNARFIYCDKNVEQGIYFGASSLDTSDYAKSHIIYNSDSIIKLGSGANPLYNIGFSRINTGVLPYLTEYNTSAPSRSNLNKNGLAKMDSDYMRSRFVGDNEISELRTVDFRNTYPATSVTEYSLNLEKGFDKLQNLYINDSCITNIKFPTNVSLRDFNVSGSNLTKLDLSNLNFIKDLDLNNCTELKVLNITNCENLKNLKINETTSKLGEVNVSSNALTSFECENSSINKITLVSTNLNSIKITSPSLKELFITSENLESIVLANCINLETLRFTENTDLSKIKVLNLNTTKISTLKDNSTVLDLSKLTNLDTFDIRNNVLVTHIQFSNDESKYIKLKNNFNGCSNLERIYGHVSLVATNMFKNCSKFTIHGTQYNNLSIIDDNGVYKTCIKKDTDLKVNDNYILYTFLQGSGVTNLNYSHKTSLASDFYKTSCSLFDVYYVLVVLDLNKRYSLSHTFEYLTNPIFIWEEQCDNSPNRYMFLYNTSNITDLTYCFLDSTNFFKILSPKRDESLNFSIDKSSWGLFTFLTACTNFTGIFNRGKFILDRDVFRLPNNTSFPITSFSYFNPKLIVDNAENFVYANLDEELILQNITKYGNLNGFFYNLLNLVRLSMFMSNTFIINYDLTNSWKLSATELYRTFYSDYATGELILSKVFVDVSTVKVINTSFIITNNIESLISTQPNALFKIDSNTLKGFNQLTSIGIQGEGDSAGTRLREPFTGFNKKIEQDIFPMDIVSDCENLTHFEGFFKNCQTDKTLINVELPGNMFEKCKKLVSVAALFYNMNIPYTLTSGGFSNCPNLKNVSYLFGASTKSLVSGSIPYKLFYHGFTPAIYTFVGIDGEVIVTDEENYTKYEIIKENGNMYYLIYSELGNVFYSKLEIPENEDDKDLYGYDKTNQIDYNDIVETITATINIPIKTIDDMSYCFARTNLNYYSHSNTWEGCDNEDYSPFNYIYKNGFFSKNKNRDIDTRTYIWEYDGIYTENYESASKLDAVYQLDPSKILILIGSESTVLYEKGGTFNFCCSPDLLRYCSDTSNTNLTYLFYGCGSSTHVPSYESVWDEVKDTGNILAVGLEGRIPPYLLKPVSKVRDLSYMFTNCKCLSYYINLNNNSAYIIPETFFAYTKNVTNLNHTFEGIILPNNVSLNVFNNLTELQSINSLFKYMHLFSNKQYNTFKNIFSALAKKLQNISHAFSQGTVRELNALIKNLYIIFDEVFKGVAFTDSTDAEKCQYVFSNYADTVLFVNKTLPTSDKFNNYTYNE